MKQLQDLTLEETNALVHELTMMKKHYAKALEFTKNLEETQFNANYIVFSQDGIRDTMLTLQLSLDDIKKKLSDLKKYQKHLLNKREYVKLWGEEPHYKDGFCFEHFGKRNKDLTPEEMREYNKLKSRESRAKQKALKEQE